MVTPKHDGTATVSYAGGYPHSYTDEFLGPDGSV